MLRFRSRPNECLSYSAVSNPQALSSLTVLKHSGQDIMADCHRLIIIIGAGIEPKVSLKLGNFTEHKCLEHLEEPDRKRRPRPTSRFRSQWRPGDAPLPRDAGQGTSRRSGSNTRTQRRRRDRPRPPDRK